MVFIVFAAAKGWFRAPVMTSKTEVGERLGLHNSGSPLYSVHDLRVSTLNRVERIVAILPIVVVVISIILLSGSG